MKTLSDYTIVIVPAGTTYFAFAPALDGCYAVANTQEDAHRELGCVFEMLAEEFAESGRELPHDLPEDAFTHAIS